MSNESVQQSLFDESERMEIKERFDRMHKTAFRVAFNFLESHFPAQKTEEYWLKTCNDLSSVSADYLSNELCQELLCVVLNYLAK